MKKIKFNINKTSLERIKNTEEIIREEKTEGESMDRMAGEEDSTKEYQQSTQDTTSNDTYPQDTYYNYGYDTTNNPFYDTNDNPYFYDDLNNLWYYDSSSTQYYYLDTTKNEWIKHTQKLPSSKKHKSQILKSNSNSLRSAGGKVWIDNQLSQFPQNDYRIFVGDLGPEASDELLSRTFKHYDSFIKARVVGNGKRRYGFVSFGKEECFLRAFREVDGKYVGSRPVKLRRSRWKDRCVDKDEAIKIEKYGLVNVLQKEKEKEKEKDREGINK